MKVVWIRGNERITFTRPSTWFTIGLRDTGKSSLLETLAILYAQKGAIIFDLFGSSDGESLAWLRSPHVKDRKVLLLKGPNVDVDSSFPCKCVDDVRLNDININDVVISSSPLYLNPDHEFYYAGKLTDLYIRDCTGTDLSF